MLQLWTSISVHVDKPEWHLIYVPTKRQQCFHHCSFQQSDLVCLATLWQAHEQHPNDKIHIIGLNVRLQIKINIKMFGKWLWIKITPQCKFLDMARLQIVRSTCGQFPSYLWRELEECGNAQFRRPSQVVGHKSFRLHRGEDGWSVFNKNIHPQVPTN